MLPQTFAFFDPLFSTGIAWSLLGVERLAELLSDGPPAQVRLDRYAALLGQEADQQQRLLGAAYAARRDFPVFRDLSFLYFACVSFEEIRQRVCDDLEAVAWRGFLGAEDRHWTTLFGEASARVGDVLSDGAAAARRRFTEWAADGIRAHNLAGLGESPTHLYGVDTHLLIERSGLLGLTAAEMRARLPRLRGDGSA